MATPNMEILAYDETPLGPLCLRRRRLLSDPDHVVTEVTLNHEFLMSSTQTDSERALARRALDLRSGDDLRVLVGGLGLGYTAREALGSPRVREVEVVELLDPVIAWLERGLIPLAGELGSDSRFRVTRGDVYARLTAPGAEDLDIVLVDVDHSPQDRLDEGDAVFYSPSGLRAARGHLRPGGVLGVWSYEESPRFRAALTEVFSRVTVEPVPFRNLMTGTDETDWLFLAQP